MCYDQDKTVMVVTGYVALEAFSPVLHYSRLLIIPGSSKIKCVHTLLPSVSSYPTAIIKATL